MGYAQLIDAMERHLLPCGVKQLTGMDCPGCGLQTALVALLRGDLSASLAANPAILPLLALFVFAVIHLRAGFRNGPRVVLVLFLLSAALMIVNYVARLGHLW
jgi:hypothetical protein